MRRLEVSMGGRFGKYGDAKRKGRFPKTGRRGEPVLEELCMLCTNVSMALPLASDKKKTTAEQRQEIVHLLEQSKANITLIGRRYSRDQPGIYWVAEHQIICHWLHG